MSLGDPYASVPELVTRLGRPDDGSFESILDGSSRAVEHFTRRQFNLADTATARVYRPIDGALVITDDFASESGLLVNVDADNDGSFEQAWTSPEHFEAGPVDNIVGGQLGWPFWTLTAVSARCWPQRRRRTVQVTATWGWETVPEAIKTTTLNVAATLASSGSTGTGGGPVKSEAIDGYSVSYALADGTTVTVLVALSTFSLATPYRRFDGFA